MAEAITITCPECGKTSTAPAVAVGRKVRCKNCEHVFVVAAPAGKKAAPAKKAADVGKKPPAGKASAAQSHSEVESHCRDAFLGMEDRRLPLLPAVGGFRYG